MRCQISPRKRQCFQEFVNRQCRPCFEWPDGQDPAPPIEKAVAITGHRGMLATHNSDELIREGHGEDMEKLATAAQELQGQLQAGASG